MRTTITNIVLALFLLLAITTPSQAGDITPSLSIATQNLSPTDTVSVIIRLVNKLDFAVFKQANQNLSTSEFKNALIAQLKSINDAEMLELISSLPGFSITDFDPLWINNSAAVTVPVNKIPAIANLPPVLSVDLNAIVSLEDPLPASLSPPEWNIDMVKASKIWALGHTGSGVVVGHMDTGVDIMHPDLNTKWRGGTNSWFDPYGENATPVDLSGHGTATLSVIVGGDAGGSSIGMAPAAQWIAVKIFDNAGGATLSAIHQGFQWLLDPDGDPATNDAPHIVNNSWGFPSTAGGCDVEFVDDVQVLTNSGIAVVFSAGNSGPISPSGLSPATYVESFAVGAVDENTDIASFSSRGPGTCEDGPFPNVVAPGVNIKAADRTFNGLLPLSYSYMSGTSFSAPHVAGAMALLKGALPDVTVSEMENAINGSAVDILNPGVDNDSGYGLLDIEGAYFSLTVDNDADGLIDSADTCI